MLESDLIKEKNRRELLIQKIKSDLKSLPEGRLRVSKKKNSLQYYCVTKSGDCRGKYISAKNKILPAALAQKDYCEKLKKVAEKELNCIKTMLKNYDNQALTDVYNNLNNYRKTLVKPYVISDEEYAELWMKQPYKRKGFSEYDPEFYTRKNERVRSKSEILIADALNDHGIPYKYECPVTIKGVGEVYVDFTMLLLPSREEYYLEHFGMMDQEQYQNDFFRKLSTFIKNDIIPGKNLFMLFENAKHPLNTRELNMFLDGIQSLQQ